jgi:hypothetical protein
MFVIRVLSRNMLRVGRDSSVGIATLYGLDCPEIESRWGEIFRIRPDRPWDPPSLLYRFCFPGVKRSGRDVNHPPLSSAEVKERVELYLYPISGPSWPVLGWILTLPLPNMFKNIPLYRYSSFCTRIRVCCKAPKTMNDSKRGSSWNKRLKLDLCWLVAHSVLDPYDTN